jgi:LPS sulfotransferase NodH
MSYTKFVVLGQERTGSTFLQLLLASRSKDVISVGEIFNQGEEIRKKIATATKTPFLELSHDPIEYLESYIYKEYPENIKAVGFRLFYQHARNEEWKRMWDYLRDSKVKIIHLIRKNLLDRYLSHQLALRSNVWATFQQESSVFNEPVILDPQDCFKDFHKRLAWQKQADDFFSGNPKIEVIYEDLCADLMDESRRIQAFLGIEFQQLVAKTVKQRTQKKSEVIANYAALKQQLIRGLSSGKEWTRTEWLDFFDD